MVMGTDSGLGRHHLLSLAGCLETFTCSMASSRGPLRVAFRVALPCQSLYRSVNTSCWVGGFDSVAVQAVAHEQAVTISHPRHLWH